MAKPSSSPASNPAYCQQRSADDLPLELLQRIDPAPATLLEIGAYCGAVGRWLRGRFRRTRLIGWEWREEATTQAASAYDQLIQRRPEPFDAAAVGLAPSSLDVVVINHVLEQLDDPWTFMQQLRALLTPGGRLYLTLFNVRNLGLLTQLAALGRWRYQRDSVLDYSHRRLFTLAQVGELLEQSGWRPLDGIADLDGPLMERFGVRDLESVRNIQAGPLKLEGLDVEAVRQLFAVRFFLTAEAAGTVLDTGTKAVGWTASAAPCTRNAGDEGAMSVAALRAARAGVKQAPGDANAWVTLGACLLQIGQPDEAQRAVRRGLRIAPRHAGLHNLQGGIDERLGRLTAALNAYRLAAGLVPAGERAALGSICSNLGRLAGKEGRYAEAVGALQQALQCGVEVPKTRSWLAGIACEQGHLPEAIEHSRAGLTAQLAHPLPLPPPSPPPRYDPVRNEQLLWRTLADLARAGVHAFPAAGTLLGLVRDGALLPFDKDMDVGLPFAEMDVAIGCLRAQGWEEEARSYGLINPRAFRHRATGAMLDLCGYQVEPSGQTIGGFWMENIPPDWQRLTEFPPLRLQRMRRPAGRVWGMIDPEPWLTAQYGPIWRTPDPDFDTVIAAHNLRGYSLLTQSYAFERILGHWLRGRLRKALATTRHARRWLAEDGLLQAVEQRLQRVLNQQHLDG